MQDNIALATQLVRDIDALEAQVKAKKDELRALLGAPPKTEAAGKKQSRKGPRPQINVADTVRQYVARFPNGIQVPEILDNLKLRDHEAAVRSVLKKDKEAGKMACVNKYWVTLNLPAKEKAPEGHPQGLAAYIPAGD